jgi:hypothetical protein
MIHVLSLQWLARLPEGAMLSGQIVIALQVDRSSMIALKKPAPLF